MDDTTPVGAPSLDERLRATQAVRALARLSRVVERAGAGLNLAHYRVLSAVAAGDERASRLAARLALGRPTVSSAVDALCRRGLLLRAEAEEDQRAVTLSLTEAGRRLLGEVEDEMFARIAELCALTPDGARVLESLVWLGDALDESYPQRLEQARAARRKQPR
ncbi:MarR family winged helix-turn-helix transcriptional regulator [Streptomyces sp. NBC_01497]|uniref:MarR family winged helix-turn-helix transcriptional regulator n=1 Tax=Streptomyces sp. NBC_01497 TaxID=2903885 RepID=UPI002E377C5F|nr:MarR family winged helix-turn-helix transcriptional regulator [Streptomyces sp. NBC_01497]